MANNSGSVHDGGHLPVAFVGVMALVPLVPWDHSVDADIGLGITSPSKDSSNLKIINFNFTKQMFPDFT